MFNETQQEIYSTSMDFTKTQLDNLLAASKNNTSALRGFFFSLTVAIEYDEAATVLITGEIYPEEKYKKIRDLFLEINKLTHAQTDTHQFIRSITDSRLFTPLTGISEQESKNKFTQEFASKMKIEIGLWMEDNRSKNLYRPKEIEELTQRYFSKQNQEPEKQSQFRPGY